MALNIRTEEPFQFGLVGSADILGVLYGGKFLCLECKTGNAVQSEQQKNFEKMVKTFGAYYFLVRSLEEAEHVVLQAAIKEGWQECKKF